LFTVSNTHACVDQIILP